MTLILRAGAAFAAALLAVPALAQTPAPAAPRPAAPAAGGPVIPGVCVYNNAGAIGTSTVGRFVVQRLQALQTEVENELRTERTAIETEGRTLQSQRATIAPATLEQRANALQTRLDAFQRRANLRQRELQATEQKALQRIGTDLDPIVRQAYAARGCGLLLDQQSIFISNPAMDITPQIVQALNGKLTTFTINRERLPDQPAAGAAAGAAARPAAATPAAQTPPATRR